MMKTSQHRHIVVEGPIGVGKTCLAQLLADHYNGESLIESVEDNPFLDKFYQNPKAAALPTQLHFLFSRVKQMKLMRQHDLFKPVQVSDFLVEKDRLFALLTLTDDELHLYEKIYPLVATEASAPDLVIYLQASTETLIKRLRQRNSASDSFVDKEYLRKIVDAYTHFFFNFNSAPLLIVNTERIDFVKNKTDFLRLASQIDNTTQSGTHYFNPIN